MNDNKEQEATVEKIPIAVVQGYGAAWIELPDGRTIWGTSIENLTASLSAQGFGIDLSSIAQDRTADFSKFTYNYNED